MVDDSTSAIHRFGGIVHDPDAETITLHLAADGTFAIVDESGGTEQSH